MVSQWWWAVPPSQTKGKQFSISPLFRPHWTIALGSNAKVGPKNRGPELNFNSSTPHRPLKKPTSCCSPRYESLGEWCSCPHGAALPRICSTPLNFQVMFFFCSQAPVGYSGLFHIVQGPCSWGSFREFCFMASGALKLCERESTPHSCTNFKAPEIAWEHTSHRLLSLQKSWKWDVFLRIVGCWWMLMAHPKHGMPSLTQMSQVCHHCAKYTYF